ncbi:hypothetical protein IJK16_00805 [Candidatus Saccharibacteria bacterium]|jgi:hypothetical protein|nr:hypothetical protein [Candidatus Saccharibacteria bacterium]
MGIIVNKEEDNSRLQERINADLRERMQTTSEDEGDDKDFAEDSEYVKELKQTSKFSWVWIVLILLALISLIFIILL